MTTATEQTSTSEEQLMAWLSRQPLEAKVAHAILTTLQVGDMRERLVRQIEDQYHAEILEAADDPDVDPALKVMIGLYLGVKMWQQSI
ncbi:MAG: hypothetical protein QM570_20240 [Planctomycetota bacterium]|jgi:hypothetical protein|nr:hypothetical protein [Planctomycetota bacterium]